MNPETDLQHSGFRRGYCPCNGKWVKCYIPPNSIGKTYIPYRLVNGIKITLGKEEYDRLPFQFTCND